MHSLKANRPMVIVALVATLMTLVACTSGQTASSTKKSTAKTAKVTAIPRPSGKPVLTVSGAISNRNRGQELVFDMDALETLANATLNTYEPFLKKRVTFTGFDMRDLLETAGVDSGARTAHITALDDYQIDLDIDLLKRGGILMATNDSGGAIPIDAGGPIRIIFPDGSATGENDDLWIWSVNAIEVR